MSEPVICESCGNVVTASSEAVRLASELTLIQTCGACPEQYDAFLGPENVGYLRLRHGFFRAECRNVEVYTATPEGDGIFDEDERDKYLQAAKLAIAKRLIRDRAELP